MKRLNMCLLVVLVIGTLLSACGQATPAPQETQAVQAPAAVTEAPPVVENVEYVDWGFSGDLQVPFRKFLADPFEGKHPGVKVTLLGGITEDALAQIKAPQGKSPIDSIMMGEMRYLSAINENILAPMTVNEVPNIALIDPEMQKVCDGYGAAWINQLIGVAYNKDLVDAPENWTDLWDPKYKGQIGIPSPAANNGFLFLVLVAKLFGGDENNLDVAFEKLDELAPFVVAANPGQLAQLLETGEIGLAVNWQTQSGPSIAKSSNLDFVIPAPGGAAVTSCYTVLANSANLDLAYQYINDALSTEFQNQIASAPWYFGPTNTSATIPAGTEKFNPPMSEIGNLIKVDWAVANKIRTEITDLFIKRYGQ